MTKGSRTLPIGDYGHKTIIIPKIKNTHSLRTHWNKGTVVQIHEEEKEIELGLLLYSTRAVKLNWVYKKVEI